MKSTVLMMLFAAVSASTSVKCYTNEAGNVLCHHDGSGKSHDAKPENVLTHHDGSGKSHDAKAEVNLKGSGGGGSGGSDHHDHNQAEINLRGGRDSHGHFKDEDLLSLAEGEGDSSVSATIKMDTYTITLISIFVAQIFFCFGICCWTKAQVSNAKKETVKQ